MNLKKWKKTVKRIFFLPPVPTLLIAIPSYGLVIYALAGEDVEPVIAYIAYFLSAYALVITITGIKGMINILVVEDDAKLNQIVCTYLNDSGFWAKGCLNVKEAYDEMYNSLYELIISDIMMPEIDGFEFARTIRQVNRNIPILFMSARDDLPSKQKGFQLGNVYVTKLRDKLSACDGFQIVTVRGLGYKAVLR